MEVLTRVTIVAVTWIEVGSIGFSYGFQVMCPGAG
jgi:hypothetical protein